MKAIYQRLAVVDKDIVKSQREGYAGWCKIGRETVSVRFSEFILIFVFSKMRFFLFFIFIFACPLLLDVVMIVVVPNLPSFLKGSRRD